MSADETSADGTDAETGAGAGSEEQPPARPQLRVLRGEPDAEQLAALLAVVAASGGGDVTAPAAPARGRWADPAALTRAAWRPGPGGWRAAGR